KRIPLGATHGAACTGTALLLPSPLARRWNFHCSTRYRHNIRLNGFRQREQPRRNQLFSCSCVQVDGAARIAAIAARVARLAVHLGTALAWTSMKRLVLALGVLALIGLAIGTSTVDAELENQIFTSNAHRVRLVVPRGWRATDQ